MKVPTIFGAIALSGTALLLAPTGARAQAATAKCTAAKIKCANGKATGLLGCHNKAEGKNVPLDPACTTKVQTKFDGGVDPTKGCMGKAEKDLVKSPCATTGDTISMENKVDAFVLDVVTELDPGYPTPVLSKCSAGKKKCVANKVKAILGCYGKNATKPDPVALAACIQKAQDKYSGGLVPAKGCFAKLEAKTPNDCLTTGDSAALEAKVDAFAVDVTAELGNAGPPPPTFLDYTTAAPAGTCGTTKDGSSVVIKNLTCGGLSIGAGASLIPEGPTPDGETFRYALGCSGSSCTISHFDTAPAVNTADPDCTNTGCSYGTPLPIPNPTIPAITSCVLNSWRAPAAGTLDLSSGNASITVPLISDTYLTGNVAQPCPKCSATGTPSSPGTGTCDRGPRTGMPCTTTSSTGYTRDCLTGGADGTHPCTPGGGACIDGSHVGPIDVDLSPLTTGTASMTDPTGNFCPGQSNTSGHLFGCFGSSACRTITENGFPYGPVTTGVPGPATLASVFCISATGNGLVDASADLPGPGAVSLPGTVLAHN
jgi:hypothetical protein